MSITDKLRENVETSEFFLKIAAVGTIVALFAGGYIAHKLYDKFKTRNYFHKENINKYQQNLLRE